jgi:hypothetical protein
MSLPGKSSLVAAYAALFTVAFGTVALDHAARRDHVRSALTAASTPHIESIRREGNEGLSGSRLASTPEAKEFGRSKNLAAHQASPNASAPE